MKNYIITGFLTSTIIILFFVTQLLSQQKDSRIIAFNSSVKYEIKGDYKNAASEIQKIYSENKNNYLINLRLGWLNYILKDYAKSLDYYNTALQLNKESIEAKIGSTYPLSALGKWDEIVEIYKNILKVDANNYTANLKLGQIYLERYDYATAKKYLEKVNKLYPAEYEPNISLGYTYYYLGNVQKAKELFTYALMLDENNSLALSGLKLIK
jgi:tetratricopeptide (TPR) repeat protein